MSLHDAYARLTPFEIAFPEPGRLRALTEAVLEEAASRRVEMFTPEVVADDGDFILSTPPQYAELLAGR